MGFCGDCLDIFCSFSLFGGKLLTRKGGVWTRKFSLRKREAQEAVAAVSDEVLTAMVPQSRRREAYNWETDKHR